MKIIKKIDVNEFPEWSSWPQMLLGLGIWKNASRTVGKIEQEYNIEKYGQCLAQFGKGNHSIEEIRAYYDSAIQKKECISLGSSLVIVGGRDFLRTYEKLIVDSVLPEIKDGDAVVELGAGFGYNLHLLSKISKKNVEYLGGEYSRNAVTLAAKVFEGRANISVEHFNFYDEDYAILKKIDRPIVLFTAHAIEQIPDISNMFKVLSKYRKKIRSVVHLEPLYSTDKSTLLGLMRQRYAEVNDYSRNLLPLLEKTSGIKITSVKRDVMGGSPLNPTSVIKWHYR